MRETNPRFEKYIFVCENERQEGVCCAAGGGKRIREILKKAVSEKGLSGRIRVSRTGCLDVCSEGPNVLLMPDNVWFKHVEEKDISKILEKAVQGIEIPKC